MFDLISRYPTCYGALLAVATAGVIALGVTANLGLVPMPCFAVTLAFTSMLYMTAIAAAIAHQHAKTATTSTAVILQALDTPNDKLIEALADAVAARLVGRLDARHVGTLIAGRHDVAEIRGGRR